MYSHPSREQRLELGGTEAGGFQFAGDCQTAGGFP